jgi:hypothetical protein
MRRSSSSRGHPARLAAPGRVVIIGLAACPQQPQPTAGSISKRLEGNKVSSVPVTVQQPQSPVVSGSRRLEGNKVGSVQAPISQPQVSRGTDSKVSAISGNKGNAVFGGMNRGTEVKKQSEQSVQSRGSMITGGGNAGSPQGGRMSSSSPGGGGVPSSANHGGSNQGGVVYQKDQVKGPERMADAMTKNDHAQAGRKMK